MRLAAAMLALLLAAAPAAARGGPPPTLLVAAASDLRQALPELAAAHEKAGGAHVEATFGSSGKLFAQVVNGAPYDAYFGADAAYARKLEDEGHGVPGTRFAYGVGRLVMWAPKGGVDVTRGWPALADPRVTRIALANPAHAPYGRAAEAALRHAGVYEAARPKLVLGENASQAAQFAASGAAQVGLVPLALVDAPGMAGGRRWVVPPASYPALVQEAVVLKRSKAQAEARAFFTFVRSPAGRKILAARGFAPAP
jgi:molybdate transport system substrate-binding protein